MNVCPECSKVCASSAGLAAHRRTHGVGVTAGVSSQAWRHEKADSTPVLTIGFTTREWAEVEMLAASRNVTPTAIVRACVQHAISTRTPNPFDTPRPNVALVVAAGAAARLCPECGAQLVKKHPTGPGRFPHRCPDCARDAEGHVA